MTGHRGRGPRSAQIVAILSYPFRLGGPEPGWARTPFAGLATVNNLSGAGDALVTVALAGSVFVSVSLHAARGRTALGLLCTVLPFAIVGPLIGPVIDRAPGGRRFIVFGAALGRLLACLLMTAWLHTLLLFPAAFLFLVCSKTHTVAKAALVPGVVDTDADLVRANARLAVGGAIYTSAAAGVGSLVYRLLGSHALLDLAVIVFAGCAGLSLYLLRDTREPAGVTGVAGAAEAGGRAAQPRGAPDRPDQRDRRDHSDRPHGRDESGREGQPGRGDQLGGEERPGRRGRRLIVLLHGRDVPRPLALAQIAMAGMRFVAGFLTALVVFAFRRQGAPLIWYGLVAAASVGGNFAGALLAPRLRRRIHERRLVGASALAIGLTATAVAWWGWAQRRPAALVLAFVVAVGASSAKTAFDAVVQRDTPDFDRSRLFARFESVFQLAWVLGALIPTLIATSLLVGFVLTAAVVLVTSGAFVAGLAGGAGGTAGTSSPGTAASSPGTASSSPGTVAGPWGTPLPPAGPRPTA